MPPHHHAHVHAGQRGVVEVGTGKGLCHEARRRGKAGRVVVAHQVVVDGLGDVDRTQRVVRLARLFAHDAHRVRRIVAADVEEVLDLVGPEHLEDFLAVLQVGLVARGAQRRGRGTGHRFEVVTGLLREVHELLVHDATHAVARAVDQLHVLETPRLQRHAHQRLVDHGGRAAALGDENFSGWHGSAPWMASSRETWRRAPMPRHRRPI
ncbi:hypothetical protein FQZ97_983110 [compost metagenome]